jgi:predicted CXXCH cytochrome family protein
MNRPRPPLFVSAVLWFLIVLAGLCPACRRASKPASPPDVTTAALGRPAGYAGHETCAECHADIAAVHQSTGHARTFALTRDSEIAGRLCDSLVNLPEPYGRYDYTCDADGAMVAIPDRFGERAFPLEYAVGSGDHAVTFFTLLADPQGETMGIEHRLSWYRSDQKLDLTPGHEGLTPALEAEFFGRVIPHEQARRCIDCHTTAVELEGPVLTNLYAGVHCEECHGPGERHVQAARLGDDAAARSSIRRTHTAREEIDLCGRCHRRAEDIGAERTKRYPPSVVRFQPVGLSQSRCFQETPGGLKCTHCHDPHSPVASRSLAAQVATCRECHSQPAQKTCPVSPAADCIRCHMPAIDLVRGISFHDHWIRVRREGDAARVSPADADHATVK